MVVFIRIHILYLYRFDVLFLWHLFISSCFLVFFFKVLNDRVYRLHSALFHLVVDAQFIRFDKLVKLTLILLQLGQELRSGDAARKSVENGCCDIWPLYFFYFSLFKHFFEHHDLVVCFENGRVCLFRPFDSFIDVCLLHERVKQHGSLEVLVFAEHSLDLLVL
jgi:hypothetical protein